MRLSFMKGMQFMLLLVFTGILITSCDNSNLEQENNFDKSYQSWLSFKESSGNSYRYMVPGSTWAGSSWETTITVMDGKVIQRHYKFTTVDEFNQ
jgi:hypothetical protein